MKWNKSWFRLVIVYLLVQIGLPYSPVSAQQITMTQQIKPLLCLVDVVEVGGAQTYRLIPAECYRSKDARTLLSNLATAAVKNR